MSLNLRYLGAAAAGLAATLAPKAAFAGEKVFSVDGDVVVTLQRGAAAGGGAGSAAGGAGAAGAVAGGVPATGDGVLWLMPVLALAIVCGAVALLGSRKAAAGARGAHSRGRGFFSVLLACGLGAALCLCQPGTGAAYAAGGVTCGGQVVVNEKGEVTACGFTIANGFSRAVTVKGVEAPEQLEGWSAAAPETAIAAGGQQDGTWSAKTLPSNLLQQLESNEGQLTLQMSVTVAVGAYTVDFDTCGVDFAVDSQLVEEGDAASEPDTLACEDYELLGWYTDKDCTQAYDFSAPVVADTTLYAKWAVKGFWLAAADAQDPAGNVVKTMSQVEADVAAIKAGDAARIAEYEKYLLDDSVHLYARWRGSTVDETEEPQAANEYVEFRVIQVGDHDGEGCGLTFQATHLLPQGYSMNSEATTVGGWTATELRASMQPGGAIYQSFDASFTSKIFAVSKAGAKGNLSDELQYSQDKFWLLSFSELAGIGIKKCVAYEGSQYKYWADKGITYDGKYDFMAIGSRANYYPADLSQGALRWWYRSPMLDSEWSGAFACTRCTRTSGFVMSGNDADQVCGVCLAFCL